MVARKSLATLIAVGALASALVTAGAASAATKLTASLSGAKEVPKAGNGRGTARLTLNAKKGTVCFNITLTGVGTAMAGHIHKGGKTVAGPIAVPLFAQPTTHPKGCAPAAKSLIRAISKHPRRYYVNVHTQQYPGGAARGQLRRP
jgi:hypothetical protein